MSKGEGIVNANRTCRRVVPGALATGVILLALGCIAAAPAPLAVSGPTLHWHSASLAPLPPGAPERLEPPPAQPLGRLAYNAHFDETGAPPPMDFLVPLQAPEPEAARLTPRGVYLAGRATPVALLADAYPALAQRGEPYLLAPPAGGVLVAYPYFLFGAKHTYYTVQRLDAAGRAVARYDHLPTHALAAQPDVLVAVERSGCCESLQWSVRIYAPDGSVTEHGCPEGACGDVVFAALAPGGPYLLGMESLQRVAETGSAVATRLFVLDGEGRVQAQGTLLFAIRDRALTRAREGVQCACSWRDVLPSLASHPVRALADVTALPDGRWRLRFQPADDAPAVWTLSAAASEPVPFVRFPAP
jgi:hypothetical protein